ncbi:MAG: deoxycytidylate deaminase [Deltaproteobacteria bacterium]|nr:deoxycytidylate deaminase [Deltaproteobacteria bacterium]
MGLPKKKTKLKAVGSNKLGEKNVGIREQIKNRCTQEIIIAFCGPMGSGVSTVAKEFIKKLKNYDYTSEYIKITDLIEENSSILPSRIKIPGKANPGERIKVLQDTGNKLREKMGNDILAQFAARKIFISREKQKEKEETRGKSTKKSSRTAYIIESLKHPEEVDCLRAIYGDMFYLVGVLCAETMRNRRMAKGKRIPAVALTLIMKRDKSEKEPYGQKIIKTVQLSDFFIRNNHDKKKQLESAVMRYLDLILGIPGITPYKNEFAMYTAQSVALLSGCLSRQIGAAITTKEGEIISTGCNDVPKFGGGLYSEEDGDDGNRCINKHGEKCINDEQKDFIKEGIEKILKESLKNIDKLLEKKLTKQEKSLVKKFNDANVVGKLALKIFNETRIKNIIEFSRAVHAELDAIIGAVNKGITLKGSILYTTTYPCHICARHIVVAGIEKVFYIEPYEKSLAEELHNDSICLDSSEPNLSSNKVDFLHYEGVAPRQYLNLFKAREKMKHNGKLIEVTRQEAIPVVPKNMDTYFEYEKKVVEDLDRRLDKF